MNNSQEAKMKAVTNYQIVDHPHQGDAVAIKCLQDSSYLLNDAINEWTKDITISYSFTRKHAIEWIERYSSSQ